jgi:hypothetical protein
MFFVYKILSIRQDIQILIFLINYYLKKVKIAYLKHISDFHSTFSYY